MNDSRLNKLIKFEGAGWAGADTSKDTDMLNCRVRTTFINDKGHEIYLEVGYYDNTGRTSQTKWHYGFLRPWHISFLFYTKNKRTSCSTEFARSFEIVKEFNKESFLWLLNNVCGASFEEIETVNWEHERSGNYWDGFSSTGKPEGDFHNVG